MKPLVPFVQVVLSVPSSDFAVYSKAASRLAREMKSEAPDIRGLMTHTLSCRDERGLVEDYLESIGWVIRPMKPGRSRWSPGRK